MEYTTHKRHLLHTCNTPPPPHTHTYVLDVVCTHVCAILYFFHMLRVTYHITVSRLSSPLHCSSPPPLPPSNFPSPSPTPLKLKYKHRGTHNMHVTLHMATSPHEGLLLLDGGMLFLLLLIVLSDVTATSSLHVTSLLPPLHVTSLLPPLHVTSLLPPLYV